MVQYRRSSSPPRGAARAAGRPVRGYRRRGGPRAGSAGTCRSPGVAGGREPPVEIERGADQREVREGLREVAEVLRLRAELLAVESQVVGVAEHLLEEESRLVQIAHARETFHVPERAHGECALRADEAIGVAVAEAIAIDQRVAHQLPLDGAQRGEPA